MKEIPQKIEKELLKFSPLVRRLLFNRQILTEEEADKFLNPSYERDVHDPFLMKNLEEAVNQIYSSIKTGEGICVFADYDCDGIPGGVILNDFFEKIGYKDFEIYIPDRHTEGYGLNIPALKEISTRGAKLLITVDLGITAVEDVEEAKAMGMAVIVTDHHLPKETLPNTLIVNPKQPGDTYPDNMLCGAGVAFKIVQGFLKKYGEEFSVKPGWEKWLLDMAGLATLADMVPLLKENRALAYYGLQVLRKTRRPGLLKLLRASNIQAGNLQEDDITFSICPKLNAAGRMATPRKAFEVLSEQDVAAAQVSADYLSKINNERKTLVATIMRSVKKKFEKREERTVIVMGDPSWRIGVLGLVAGKIVEEYKMPAFVWGLEGSTVIKGSCRSDGSVNLVELMGGLPEGSLLEFGGHEGAGGFSVTHEEVHFLEERLASVYEKVKKERVEVGDKVVAEVDLSLSEVNEKTFTEIEKLAPFGVGNPKPVFGFQEIEIVGIKIFGKASEHLELQFEDENGRMVKAISFFKQPEDFGQKVAVGNKINLTAHIEKSVFGYKKEIRLRIIEIN